MDLKKITYSIGQVSEIADVPQSTIRYWETVIDVLHPHKTEGGSRRYSQDDIEILLKIKTILYDEGRTIKGVNKYFQSYSPAVKNEIDNQNSVKTVQNDKLINRIKEELMEIRELLNSIRD